MISLLVSMLQARRMQALTVFLLSAVAAAAAVAGPVALRTVDLAVVRHEVDRARTNERVISVVGFTNPSDTQSSAAFDSIYELMLLPGFDVVRTGELEAFLPVPDGTEVARTESIRVAFRDRVCGHIVIVDGRCVASSLEIVLGENTAKQTGLRPGDIATIRSAIYSSLSGTLEFDGGPATLTVVGTYRPRDPNEVYWGAQTYFPTNGDGTIREPIFVTAQTFDLIEHTNGLNVADAIASPEVFSLDRLAGLSDEVEAITDPEEAPPPSITVSSAIPDMVDRIDRSRALAAQLVPVAFVPLVALCWFVVFLAVSYGLVARRHEIGLVSLRGTSSRRRWWLAVGESSVAILAGAPVGYLLGHGVVSAIASAQLGGTEGSGLNLVALPYALVAVAGALGVAVLGQRRSMAEPVVDLLRGVPRKGAVWRLVMVEVALLLLAGLGVLQLHVGAVIAGIGLLVPGLVVVAVAVALARIFVPVSGWIARAALRSGRLGAGLAAIQLARRPGSQRLFALLAVALGLLTFVAAGTGVAAAARDDRSSILVGAPVVLSVDRAGVGPLLHATRAVDPEGRWAMAVMTIDPTDPQAPPVLAVDSARLGAVATWRPQFGLTAAQVAEKLRPPPARPTLLRGDSFTIDLERDAPDAGGGPGLTTMTVILESIQGGTEIRPVIQLSPGRRVYEGRAQGCASGCRLVGFSFTKSFGQFTVKIYGARGGEPDSDFLTPPELGDRQRWSGSIGSVVAAFNGVLNVQSERGPFRVGPVDVAVVDAPEPAPVVSTAPVAGGFKLAQGKPADVSVAANATMLPRLGGFGSMVDLEYLQRLGMPSTSGSAAEVWLGPQAPADAVTRLRQAGLSVRVTNSVERSRADLEQAGPAMALRFHTAAAALGIVLALGGLGLVATVDRRRRAEDLSALRVQGLPRRFVRRASGWGYLWLVAGAAAAGLLAGASAWYATGQKLPVFTDTLEQLPPPRWPAAEVVVVPWSLATAGMIVAAIVAGWALRAAVRTTARRS